MIKVRDPLLCGGMEVSKPDEELKIAIYINSDSLMEKTEPPKNIESILSSELEIEFASGLMQSLSGGLMNNLTKESVCSPNLAFFKKDDTDKEIAEEQKKTQNLIAIEHSYSIKK